MKSFRSHLIATAVLMAAAEAQTATGTSPAPEGAATGGVPDSNAPAVAGEAKPKRAPKNPDNKLNIINGRLPLPLVFLIRFKETSSTAERAKKFGTSVGKVFDIQKGRNFGYIDAGYKPSAEEVAAANAWCDTAKTFKGQTLKESGGDPDAIKAAVAALGVATQEEVAARKWERSVAPKTGGTAPVADGGAAPTTAAAPAGEQPAAEGAKLF